MQGFVGQVVNISRRMLAPSAASELLEQLFIRADILVAG